MPGHDEAAFETAIEFGLTRAGGYEKLWPMDYDESPSLERCDHQRPVTLPLGAFNNDDCRRRLEPHGFLDVAAGDLAPVPPGEVLARSPQSAAITRLKNDSKLRHGQPQRCPSMLPASCGRHTQAIKQPQSAAPPA